MPEVNAVGNFACNACQHCMQAVNGGSASSHGVLPFRKGINRSGSGEILRSLPGPSLFVCACWLPDAAPPQRSGKQLIPDGSPPQRLGQQHLRYAAPGAASQHGASASNKPHLAEKSAPVWLAIWHIWAGFANSQHRYAAFATPKNICAHSSLLQH